MFHVTVERYSLAAGRIGEPIGHPEIISSHESKRAAGRVLGSLISGKMARTHRRDYEAPGVGLHLYALDTETGERFARNACR